MFRPQMNKTHCQFCPKTVKLSNRSVKVKRPKYADPDKTSVKCYRLNKCIGPLKIDIRLVLCVKASRSFSPLEGRRPSRACAMRHENGK